MAQSLNLTIIRKIGNVNQNGRIMQLRQPLDPLIVDLLAPEPANFSHGTYYHTRGGFGDVTNFLYIGEGMINYMLSIQPPEYPRPVLRNKLVYDGFAVHPYYYANDRVVFGNTVPLGNKIRVATNASGALVTQTFRVKFPARDYYEDAVMVKVDGFTADMQTRPTEQLIAEGRVGYWYEITSNWKVYRSFAGLADVLCPFWTGFQCNGGEYWLPLDYFEG